MSQSRRKLTLCWNFAQSIHRRPIDRAIAFEKGAYSLKFSGLLVVKYRKYFPTGMKLDFRTTTSMINNNKTKNEKQKIKNKPDIKHIFFLFKSQKMCC